VYILSGRPREQLDRWFADLDVGLSAEHGCFYKHPAKVGHYYGTSDEDSSAPDLTVPMDKTAGSSVSSSGGSIAPLRRPMSDGWVAMIDQVDSSWRKTIQPLFQHYTERTPGSFIEEKEFNLTWHYRNADPEFGSWQASELQVNLEKILSHMAVSVLDFNSRSWLAQRRWSFDRRLWINLARLVPFSVI
jgi:trehalose 6-phosphate synthase/phosphatase